MSRLMLPVCGSVEPALERRPILSEDEATGLAALFKAFSNGTRLRLLHALVRSKELSVTGLARATGMKPQAVSNQLQRLGDRGMLASRRDGSNVLYRIVDPCVRVLLERGLCLLECPPGSHDAEALQAGSSSCRVVGEPARDRLVDSMAAGSR